MRVTRLNMLLLLLVLAFVPAVVSESYEENILIAEGPSTALNGVAFEVEVKLRAPYQSDHPSIPSNVTMQVFLGDEEIYKSTELQVHDNKVTLVLSLKKYYANKLTLKLVDTEWLGYIEVYVIPGYLSLFPSIFTVVLAIAFRQVIIALGAGIFLGSVFVNRYNPFTGGLRALDTTIVGAIAQEERSKIIFFCLLLGGMIGVLTKGGGAAGMANFVTRFAKTPMSVQLSTWVMGGLVFFDDYANALITGSTMRPITDRVLISREKLSFIVDSCAATISSLAVVSSWIGVEVAYMADNFKKVGLEKDAYLTFLQTIPWRFYPVQMLIFVLATILLRRDFGPMYWAEERARRTGKVIADSANCASSFEDADLSPIPGKPLRAINAVLPVLLTVSTIFAGLYYDGYTKAENTSSFREVIGSSDPFRALIWASMLGGFVSIGMVVVQRILSLSQAMEAWVNGSKSMIFAILILMHAWALNDICTQLHTANYLVTGLKGHFDAGFLPLIVFIVSAIVAFSTGSSWGTMGILFPLVIPLADGLAHHNDRVLLGTISSILAGSVWGDHCSPISDSCIMSSMATSCDHRHHVQTQIVYACTVAFVSIVFGSLPCGMGWYSPYVGQLIGIVVLIIILLVFGKRTDTIKLELEFQNIDDDPESGSSSYTPLLDDVAVEPYGAYQPEENKVSNKSD